MAAEAPEQRLYLYRTLLPVFIFVQFDAAVLGPRYSNDSRRFCGHQEVRRWTVH